MNFLSRQIILLKKNHLFPVVRYRLQDSTQSLKTDGDIQQMRSKEEVIEVTQDGECEVP